MLGSLLAALAVASAPASYARADTPPSHWDRARDPNAGRTYRLHVEIQRILTGGGGRLTDDDGLESYSPSAEALKLMAARLLERANAAESPDVRLRFDLGRLYLSLGNTAGGDYFARASRVLKEALRLAPDHPAAEKAWLALAFACGHLADHVCERSSYLRVLRINTEDVDQLTPSLNLAETEMHLGNLTEAIEGYRETLRLAGRVSARDSAPLAVWGLAVALDRAGDAVGAEKEARFAIEIERGMGLPGPLLHSKGVFFVPDYEINWYDGLGFSAEAKIAPRPSDALRLWRLAELSWSRYVQLADHNDRWLALAKLRLAGAKAGREAAEKAAAKQLKPKTPPAEDGEERDRTL